ncbi:MAG: glycosyltransferase family 39 protein [Pseudomonadota bacterium]|nr:glycosyltransferase family 39 protein [Pseudomonadota bacterium]
MPSPPKNDGTHDHTWIAAIGSTAVAFGVRAAWLIHFQRPADGVFSDMKGYIGRARDLLEGSDAEVCFAPGSHWLYAAEMTVFGPDGLDAMGWVHVALGTLVAPVAVLLARRCLGSAVAAAIVGLVVALWYPLVSYGGYFSSEVPYTLALATSVWAWVRYVQTGRGAGLAGVVTGLGYLVRPPILLAVPLLVGWALWRRAGSWRGHLAFLAPVVCAVAFGAARYHDRTGRVGLIADNGAVMSLFAFSDYSGVEATPPPGVVTEYNGFHPPARGRKFGFDPEFRFDGLRCDPSPLNAERDRVIAASSWSEIAVRLNRNVSHLYADNVMWPERKQAKEGVRKELLDVWPRIVASGLLPLVALGVLGTAVSLWARRGLPGGPRAGEGDSDALVVPILHLVVMVLAALAYTGEIRYRVPYDPLLITLAAVGPVWVVRFVRARIRAPG